MNIRQPNKQNYSFLKILILICLAQPFGTVLAQDRTLTVEDLTSAMLCRSNITDLGELKFLRLSSRTVHDEETAEATLVYLPISSITFLGFSVTKVVNNTFEIDDDVHFILGGKVTPQAVAKKLAEHFKLDPSSAQFSKNSQELVVYPFGMQASSSTQDKISISRTPEGVRIKGTGKCDAISIRARLDAAKKHMKK